MIPKDCKRLAEVDFPIAEVSKHAAREKSIRHGHPSTLHLWWARRPLASSRAMLLALLLPDPCDPACPRQFKATARELLQGVQGKTGPTDDSLQQALLKFIGDYANWELAQNKAYVEVGRTLVRAAHGSPDGSNCDLPSVVDPFSGGGSIPLEALRLGCEAFASDLNPVACLILRILLEDIPRRGPSLSDGLANAGARVKAQAERELAALYPRDSDGAVPIAYVWARTVCCESPGCGAEIPLTRSFWLSKKAGRRRALRYGVHRGGHGVPRLVPEIFAPVHDGEVPLPTARNGRAICIACGQPLAAERVCAQLAAAHGGANCEVNHSGRLSGATLLAVVLLREGKPGRHYRLPHARDYEAIAAALSMYQEMASAQTTPSPFPDEPLPSPSGKGYASDGLYFNFFPLVRYGLKTWGDFFSVRQNVALATIARIVRVASRDYPPLLLALGKLVDLSNTACPWEPIAECPRNVLSNGRVKPSWSFAEAVPIGSSAGSFIKCLENLIAGIQASMSGSTPATVRQAPAQSSPLPDESVSVWFTDPPYYDAIPYAALSDAFWVWLKRANVASILPSMTLGEDGLAPKEVEIIDDLELLRGHRKEHAIRDGIPAKDKSYFENQMAIAFSEGGRVLQDGGVGCVVFAHQTTEGWEALLAGMIRSGLVVTGSWPIATEMAHRLRARESAALGTSVHLVCRPRPDDAGVGDWADVLRELPVRVGDWMERLQHEGVRGADLIFACIGPALEIFSRYKKVETAEGREVKLDEYLAKVWEVVGRAALAQVLGTTEARARNGAAGAVEEDARLTALFLWTLQVTDGEGAEGAVDEEGDQDDDEDEDEEGGSGGKARGFTLIFDVVRRFAQPLGIELSRWEDRVIETKKGVVRLLPVAERAKQLFGEDGASAVAARLETEAARGPASLQGMLFPDSEAPPRVRGARGAGRRRATDVSDQSLTAAREATTLDRVHAAMLLQSSGRTNALRALLKGEQDRGPEFLRLANALSALYPKGSEEKRLLDAMLLAVPR